MKQCGMCDRKEHKTGKGICQFCWGTCIRRTEFLGVEPCHMCVCIFPEAPLFCIHDKQWFECKTCMDELRATKGDPQMAVDLSRRTIVRRIGDHK